MVNGPLIFSSNAQLTHDKKLFKKSGPENIFSHSCELRSFQCCLINLFDLYNFRGGLHCRTTLPCNGHISLGEQLGLDVLNREDFIRTIKERGLNT